MPSIYWHVLPSAVATTGHAEDTGQTLATEPAMTLVRVRVYETSEVS